MFRNLLRYVGLMLILAVFIAAGLQMVTAPAISAAIIAKSRLPQMLKIGNIILTLEQFTFCTQLCGAITMAFSLFILLGVGRTFFSFLLAIGTTLFTVALHINLDDPSAITEMELLHVLKNLSIVGGLLFVTGSGHRSRKYSQAHEANERVGKKNN